MNEKRPEKHTTPKRPQNHCGELCPTQSRGGVSGQKPVSHLRRRGVGVGPPLSNGLFVSVIQQIAGGEVTEIPTTCWHNELISQTRIPEVELFYR